MNSLIAKALWSLPWFNLAKYLLAELGWQRDVALWLEKQQEWYFQLAAKAWGAMYEEHPDQLKLLLAAKHDEATP